MRQAGVESNMYSGMLLRAARTARGRAGGPFQGAVLRTQGLARLGFRRP